MGLYVVKLQDGPIFALFNFLFENLILPAERRGFLKNKQNTTKKHIF